MGVLEQIMQMRNQGMGNEEIAASLREQNISPKTIIDAFNQAEIKNAVSDASGEARPYETGEKSEYPDQIPMSPSPNQPYPTQNTPEMQAQVPQPEPEVYAPQPAQQEQYYTPEAYSQAYGNYEDGGSMGMNTDTIIEVSEQVFSEKISGIRKELDDLKEFKTLSQTRLDSALERLKRIEKVMDQLQISILKKIGSYGENLESIKKEMSMMQDSFGKMVGPISQRKLKKSKHKPKSSKTSYKRKTSKKK